jgi:hypothetical protein
MTSTAMTNGNVPHLMAAPPLMTYSCADFGLWQHPRRDVLGIPVEIRFLDPKRCHNSPCVILRDLAIGRAIVCRHAQQYPS